MAVSEMQVEVRLRPVVAEFEKQIFEVVSKLQQEVVKTDVQRVQNDLMMGHRTAQDQYSELIYHPHDDPELRSIPPAQRRSEQAKLNKPAREVLRVIKYLQKHPATTPEELQKLRTTMFREFPPHLSISIIPLIVQFGETYARLAAIQKLMIEDGDD